MQRVCQTPQDRSSKRGVIQMTPSDDPDRRRKLKAAFRMPSVQSIAARKSTISNAFVNSLLPLVRPTPDEIAEALRILNMVADDVRCSYCGDPSSEWDHLRPLVLDGRPTGYISEIANLVPSCSKCNQSKRNEDWRTWILSMNAKRSPTSRGIKNLADRIQFLEQYERWRSPTRIDFESLISKEEWDSYWSMREEINEELLRCHGVAKKIKSIASRLLADQAATRKNE